MTPFGGSEPEFDPVDEFVADNVPEAGPFLADGEVLAGEDHLTVHRQAADAFEEHGVYDATFGYNLARLNRDPRHPNAGFRYAVDPEDPDRLRAEFTPTTAFCPQAEPLAVGAFRALNRTGIDGFDEVVVRVDDSLQGAERVNDRLRRLERGEEELDGDGAVAGEGGLSGRGGATGDREGSSGATRSPF